MTLSVDTHLPAGNACIHTVDGDTITLTPDLRDTPRPWFYWLLRARGCAGRSLTFAFSDPNTLTVHGAAYSIDQGRHWRWITDYDPDRWSFHHTCGRHDEVWFCLAMPYTRRDLDYWLAAHADHPRLAVRELCQTPTGTSVPLLELGPDDDHEQVQVVLTARHHCCEMMASWALEGALDRLLDDAAVLDRCRVLVVPFMDMDGVQRGDQGKSRHPHDHNRDYFDGAIYAETRALMNLVRARCDHRLRGAFDLHCPWVRGDDTNHHIYLVGSRDPANWKRQQAFARLLEKVNHSPLPYHADRSLPYGQGWNTTPSMDPGMTCANWMRTRNPNAITTATIEIPYAEAEGATVDADAARAFGAALARAMIAHVGAR